MSIQDTHKHIWDSEMATPSALIVAFIALIISYEHTGLGQFIAEWASALSRFSIAHSDYLTGEFARSLVGALAGAWGGAFAAQKIAEKAKSRELLLTEMRNVNALTTIAFDLLNAFLAVKSQHVLPMKMNYDKQWEALRTHIQEIKSGTKAPSSKIHTPFDFQIFNPPNIPSTLLSTLAFERVSLNGPQILLVTTLLRTFSSFCETVEARTKIANAIKEDRFDKKFKDFEVYFGLETPEGHLDESYKSTVAGCASLLDDCLFFSYRLYEASVARGVIIRASLGKDAPKVLNFHLSDKAKRIMPGPENYKDWVSLLSGA